MKKFTLILGALAVAFTATFCTKEYETKREPQNLKYVGVYHNEGFDYVFHDIKSKVSGKEYNNELESLLEMCYNASVDYLTQERFFEEFDNWGERLYFADTVYNWAKDICLYDTRTLEDMYENGVLNLSEAATSIIDEMYLSSNNEETSLNDFETLCDNLLIEANSKLSGAEREAVIATIYVAKFSANYWYENAEYWASVLTGNNGAKNSIGKVFLNQI